MKRMNVMTFFAVFFALYGLLNYYIFIRGWQALPEGSLRSTYLAVFLLLSLSFIAGRVLERSAQSFVSDALVWIGSFWLAAMLYFFLIVLVLDIMRGINALIPFFPSIVTADAAATRLRLFCGGVSLVAVVLAAGHINARTPRVRRLTVTIPKHTEDRSPITVVAASDIHLGTIVGRSRLEQIVRAINNLHPDVVLLPGDIVDEDLGPVLRQNLGETLRNISTRYGVYAVTGNHEYIGGAEEACAYLRDHGIVVLRDSQAIVGNRLCLVGREDRSIGQFAGRKRKPLEELMQHVDRRLPVILMDHQPFRLGEAAANGIDLQLSGHTHHGQLWPLNYITSAVYEVSRGYARKGGTHIFVSSGVGTWGPPVRIGNTPEIVSITLRFDGASDLKESERDADIPPNI